MSNKSFKKVKDLALRHEEAVEAIERLKEAKLGVGIARGYPQQGLMAMRYDMLYRELDDELLEKVKQLILDELREEVNKIESELGLWLK